MLPPNILITNFCNQNCSFCFARAEMGNKLIKKGISLRDFKNTLLKMKKVPKIKVVKLLGGEPTLHSTFKEIIQLSLNYFPSVQIFTNGIFTDDLTQFLIKNSPNVGFTFNITTPGFLLNPKIRLLVLKRIVQLAKKAKITFSLTYDVHTDINLIFKTQKKDVLSKISGFRLGLANPTAGQKNYYFFKEFPNMGKKTYQIVKKIRDYNQKAKISLNCGFTRCMFTDKQFDYLKKNRVIVPGFGCFGKEAYFDLQTDLSAFHCFPLSTINKISTPRKSFNYINKKLLKKRFYYWSKIKQNVCLKCPFYGFEKNKCPGPCIAFLINKSRNDQ